MRRNIACIISAAVTLLFMVLRIVNDVQPTASFLTLSLSDCMLTVALITMAVVAGLSFSKQSQPVDFDSKPQTFFGWVAIFNGSLLVMSSVLDIFYRSVDQQVVFANNIDRYTAIFSLLFGLCSGVFLILQGFCSTAQSQGNPTMLKWLSLTPILWMWFRLARYEISTASIIDISESFFEFATLVTSLLFYLQLARYLTKVGTKPKNGLLIFSLFTVIICFSGTPLTLYKLATSSTVSSLLTALVDNMTGLLALSVALTQMMRPAQADNKSDTSQDADPDLAWNDPVKERAPLNPPFSVDQKLPTFDETDIGPIEVSSVKADKASDDLTVDDILAELNKDLE